MAEAIDLKYEIMCVARSGRPAAVHVASRRPSTETTPSRAEESKGAQAGAPPASPSPREKTAAQRKATDATPGFDPVKETRFMELMAGTNRQFLVFAGPGGSPVIQPQEKGSGDAEAQPTPSENNQP